MRRFHAAAHSSSTSFGAHTHASPLRTSSARGSATVNSTSLTLVGGNAISADPGNFVPACTGASVGVPGPCQISFTTSTIITPFVFDWAYSSADSAGSNDDLLGC
jgi:hypothetical protein